MSKVVILDFGTARVKVLFCWKNGDAVSYDLSSVETNFGKYLDMPELSEAQRDIEIEVNAGFSLIEKQLYKFAANSVICIATEAFRGSKLLKPIANEIKRRFGNLTILNSDLEAKLFYESVKQIERLDDFIAIDVGGGSVQVVWGIGKEEYASSPIGTYSLEKKFQVSNKRFIEMNSQEVKSIHNEVLNSIESSGVKIPNKKHLVIGSNIMRDFFKSALKEVGLAFTGEVGKEQICSMYSKFEGKNYSDLLSVFPSNPGFIFGADKLFIIILSFMEILSKQSIRVTNASIAKGLAEMAIGCENRSTDTSIPR